MASVMRGVTSRRLTLWALIVAMVVICSVVFFVIRDIGTVRLSPQEEIAVKWSAYNILEKIDDSLSLTSDWPSKDEYAIGIRKLRERLELVEYTLGQGETAADSDADEPTRIVIPILSMKMRDRATGRIWATPAPGDPNLAGIFFEKRKNTGGVKWRIVEDPNQYPTIWSEWSRLPRRSTPRMLTITLKKAVVVEIASDGKVVRERLVVYDE